MHSLACPSCSTVLMENGREVASFEVRRETNYHDYSYDFWGPDYATRRRSVIEPHSDREIVGCGRCGFDGPAEMFFRAYEEIQKRKPKKPKEIIEKRIAGIRSWKVDKEGNLLSLAASGYVWKAGEEGVASCPDHGSAAPTVGCPCGFNAFFSLREWKEQEDSDHSSFSSRIFSTNIFVGSAFDPREKVVGIASASGRTILAEHGWKSERARVEAIIAYKPEIEALGTKIDLHPALKRVADKYGVPLIELDEIDAFCLVQNLEQIGSLKGQPGELPQSPSHIAFHPLAPWPSARGGWKVYPPTTTTNINVNTSSFSSAMKALSLLPRQAASNVNAFNQQPSKPNNFKAAIEGKKNRKPFYDSLDKKKGLDKKPKGV